MPLDNQLRVVFLTVAGPWSGAEVHTVNLAGVFEQRGHSVKIAEFGEPVYSEQLGAKHPLLFCADKRGQCCEARVPLKRSFRHWHQSLKVIPADVAILVKGNFHVGGAAMEAAARICFKTFITIEHMRAPLPPRPEMQFFQSAQKPFGLGLWWYITKIKGFTRSTFPQHSICVSQAVAETLTRDYHFPSSKLTVAYTGVDNEKLSPNPAHRQKTRQQFGLDDDVFVFGTLGRLSPMKNHALLLKAFALLAKNSNKKSKLVIVGNGPESDALRHLVEKLNLTEQVVFSSFTPQPEKVYPAFDVFCLTSTDEALPISLIEALSCGVPAIATKVGGVPEVLQDEHCGWLVKNNDVDSLAATLEHVSNLPLAELQPYREKARDLAAKNFNIETCFTKLCLKVESLAG
ncbi:MAG: glycosyltransferase family 4 protein [Marinobacter sp.]|uniref:glycosyltransferase family 4 protein n=1 Tax=Marinobacter sp. TaxID=50741 RepID=UPI00329A4056